MCLMVETNEDFVCYFYVYNDIIEFVIAPLILINPLSTIIVVVVAIIFYYFPLLFLQIVFGFDMLSINAKQLM